MFVSNILIIKRGRANNTFTYIKPGTYEVESLIVFDYYFVMNIHIKTWLTFVAIGYYENKYIKVSILDI